MEMEMESMDVDGGGVKFLLTSEQKTLVETM